MDGSLDSQSPLVEVPERSAMPLAMRSQLVLTVGRHMVGFDALQRNASRFPVRQKLVRGVHIMQSALPIRTFLLQMLLEPEQPWMNRRRRRPLPLHLSEQCMNPVCQPASPVDQPVRQPDVFPAEGSQLEVDEPRNVRRAHSFDRNGPFVQVDQKSPTDLNVVPNCRSGMPSLIQCSPETIQA